MSTVRKISITLLLLLILITLVGCQKPILQGSIALPEDRLAFEPVKLKIAAVDSTSGEPIEQLVTIPIGANTVDFSLEGLSPESTYFVRYWLLSEGGKGDNKGRMYGNTVQYSFLSVGGLSVMNHAYTKEGLLQDLDGAMTNQDTAKGLFSGKALLAKPLALSLIPETGVFEATEKILSDLIQPNMSDYDKQWAIYNYCVQQVPATTSQVTRYFRSEINDYDNPLVEALLNKKTIWLGQPFLMHWLMSSAGLSCELVEIHPYLSYYPQAVVMSRHVDAYYQSNPLMASVYISQGGTNKAEYYMDKFFNYPVGLLENTHAKLVFRDEKPRYFGRGALYPPIKQVLDTLKLGEADLITIECKVQLPKGVYGSDNGIWGGMTVRGDNTPDTKADDFSLSQDFVLRRNRRSHVFTMTVVNTGAPYTLTYRDTVFGLKGEVTVEMPKEKGALTVPASMVLTLPENPQ